MKTASCPQKISARSMQVIVGLVVDQADGAMAGFGAHQASIV